MHTKTRHFLAALLVGTTLAGAAEAQEAVTQGWKEGSWMVRGRIIGVLPDEDSSVPAVNGTADFSEEVVPELDFTYFFTDNWAAELILATAKHDATARTGAGASLDVGSAWVLPPTLTLQYHFQGLEGWKPYVGAGINYTMYLNEDPGTLSNINMEDSFGVALQAGVDVPIDDSWSWNFDVKKIFTNADAQWNNGTIRADIELDPWVVGTGIGYRF